MYHGYTVSTTKLSQTPHRNKQQPRTAAYIVALLCVLALLLAAILELEHLAHLRGDLAGDGSCMQTGCYGDSSS